MTYKTYKTHKTYKTYMTYKTPKLLCTLLLLFAWWSVAMAQQETDDSLALSAELPEGMQTREIDSLLASWQTSKFLLFDEHCETTGENPDFDAETYAKRLSRLPNVVDMPYHNVVQDQ